MTERQFLIDINPNIELPKYELVLYSLYEQPITELYNITNFNIKPFFIGIDEISFNIPMTRNEADGQIVKNEIYDMVDGEYYILLNDAKFFVINKINEKVDSDGKIYKEVSAYSREFELTQKKLIDYKANSRMLYDRTNSMLKDEETGLTIERGILNYIFNHVTKGWTIGTVDEKVVSLLNEGISRALNFPNSNLIQVFQELQKTYNCVFKFDTINRVVNVESMLDYDINPNEVENSPQFKGLYISDENFIKNMSKNIEYDKVKTRLFLYGKDNISIQTVTPVGLPYIDNFTTFKNTKFMTQELIDKLNEYETLVANANPNFQPKRELLQQKHQELEDLYNADDKDDLNKKGLVALQRQLSLVQTEIDTRVENLAIIKSTISSAEGIDLEDLYVQMKTVQSEIDAFENQKRNIKSLITTKENQIETKNNEIKAIEAEIQAIKDSLSVQAVLSPKLIKELDKFIRVETYNDSNFTEDNIMELYEEGKKNLAKISQPSIQFDVDVVDFLSIVECQHTWDKFVLGDIVLLENKNIGFSYYVRLVSYEHNPDSNSLRLYFSNTNSFDDATLWIKDLLEQMSNTSSTLDFNKYKWDKTDNMQSNISKMIDAKLEEARQSILNAVGQRHLFDDAGLWLYKENPDGSINDEQIRAINNTIALTTDNWQSPPVWALDPTGINAEVVRGKLGQFAKVNAEQIEVGMSEQPLLDYIDEQGRAITVHQILLSNENQSIVTDSNGVTASQIIIQSEIEVYRGITKVNATFGQLKLKNSSGGDIALGTMTLTIANGILKWTIPSGINIPSDSGWIEIPITVEGKSYTKKLTWNKSRAGAKGDTGASAIVGVLSNNSHTVPTDSAGNNGNYTGCSTTMSIYIGRTNDSANWTVTASASSGITGSLSGKTYTVTNMTVDTGYVDLTAKRTGYADIVMRFNISKNKQGNAGQNSTAYWLVTDVSAINKSQAGAYNPTSLNISAKSQTGTSKPIAYAGRFIIAETTDGTTFTDKYTSTANESSKSYIPSANIKAIRIRLYLAGGTSNLLDEEIIPVVSDGVKGNDAKIVTIVASHSHFIRNKEGVTPDTITLTPNFQNCIYSKWEYNINDEGWSNILKTTPSTSEPWIDSNTKVLTIPKQFNLYKKLIDIPPFRYVRSSQKGGWFTYLPEYRVWREIKIFANGVNIAKNKTVTSSKTALSLYPLTYLVDDDENTMTAIENAVLDAWEWVKIDLGSIRNDVDSILHYTTYVSGEDFAAPIKLEVSPDNVNWFTIYNSDVSGIYTEPEGGKLFRLTENINDVKYRASSTTGEQDIQTIINLYDSSELAKEMENTIKQNFYYNRTKITEQEGIEVYDNLGRRVLQTGSFDSDGDGTKDMYGHVIYHSDGSFSALTRDGVLKRTPYGDNYYLNSVEVIEGQTICNGGDNPPLNVTLTLPKYMRNRNVTIYLVLKENSLEYLTSKQSLDGDFTSSTRLSIVSQNLSAIDPYVVVSAYSYLKTFGTKNGIHYTGVAFYLIAISN